MVFLLAGFKNFLMTFSQKSSWKQFWPMRFSGRSTICQRGHQLIIIQKNFPENCMKWRNLAEGACTKIVLRRSATVYLYRSYFFNLNIFVLVNIMQSGWNYFHFTSKNIFLFFSSGHFRADSNIGCEMILCQWVACQLSGLF